MQHDIDVMQQKLREFREDSTEKEGRMKLALMNMASVEKQKKLLEEEVKTLMWYIDSIKQLISYLDLGRETRRHYRSV